MKYFLLITFGILFNVLAKGQYKLVPGYFINASQEKIECEFSLRKWNVIPEYFEYTLDGGGNIDKIPSDSIIELVAYEKVKYVRREIVDYVQDLPMEETTTVLLQVLIEGEATLFVLPFEKEDRFYYQLGTDKVRMLIYSKSEKLVDRVYQTKADYSFRSQLAGDLKCEGFGFENFQSIEYSSRDLLKLFQDFNECISSDQSDFAVCVRTERTFKGSIKAGITNYQVDLPAGLITYKDKSISGIGWYIGLELEAAFSKKNNWAVMIEPAFVRFNSTMPYGEFYTYHDDIEGTVDYKALQFPISFRHYFITKPAWKLFGQAGAGYHMMIDSSFKRTTRAKGQSEVKYEKEGAMDSYVNPIVAIGGKYKKMGIEMRYEFKQDLLGMTDTDPVDFRAWNVVLSYRVF
ncbi:hypothetical protein [Carboxylicivirga sp. N1Y90]|uniref:hypothetical protein n=1 Tax=Carboxylicivirga fragile TaxID=3417571 RepID=UPI003D33005B|nr:outer membrane beta-barrel protein [Marinilabiliaceae bacterium N1Y90]